MTTTNAGDDVEKFMHCWWDCKMVWPSGKQFFKKLTCNITGLSNYNSGHLSQRNENLFTGTCIQMFIVVLFLIAQIWKQPRYPSQPEHPYHGILSDNKKWRNCWYKQQLGWISKELQWEKSQSKKATYHIIPFI